MSRRRAAGERAVRRRPLRHLNDDAVIAQLVWRLRLGMMRAVVAPLPPLPVPPPPKGEPPAAAEELPPAKETAWLEIELKDDEDPPKPVPFAIYRVELPDGRVVEGSLDGEGKARLEGIDPGSCKVTFPELQDTEWRRS